MKEKSALIIPILVGVITVSVFVTLVTIFGELVPPIKNWLKDAHYHHWVGKGIWAGILFVVAFIISYPLTKRLPQEKWLRFFINSTVVVLVAAPLILLLFFIYEFVIHH